MCYAVQGDRPLWKNTNVTAKEIRQVFRLSPCLTCVLAKKRKEGMAQWKPRKKFKRLRKGKELSDSPDRKPSTKLEMDTQDDEDSKRYKPGELLSCDNVGPVNPKSFEGYTQTFIWRDTCIKRMFSYSDSEATEDVYLRKYASTTRSTVYGLRSSARTTSRPSSLGRYVTTIPSTA